MRLNQELDVTREELRELADYLDERGLDASYNDSTDEVILIINDNIITIVQSARAEADEDSEAYYRGEAQREVEHSW